MTTKRVFKRTSQFICGGMVRSTVDRWEWTKAKGLWVYFTDGLACKSEYTLATLRKCESVVEVKA